MGKFYGFRFCNVCKVACTPGNFLDNEGKRYCTACWLDEENPSHPDIKEIRDKNISAAKDWKCAKWSREEGPLPLGPKSHRN